jgi:hypothetical protein
MNHVTVKAPYGVTWRMTSQEWARLAARLGDKAKRYQVQA